jgi:uncharacterized membrane protein YdjX (TVP38/TMEM64 family)
LTSRNLIKVLLLFAFITLGAYLFVHHQAYLVFIDKQRAIKLLTSFGRYSVPGFISLQILQVVIAPIPGDVTGLIGGYLYGPAWGTLYSTIGLTIGSWLAFALARLYGLPFVEKAISPSFIQKYDYFMKHRGVWVSFLLFLIPGFPKDYLCYILGLSHMSTWTFLLVSTTGKLYGTLLLSVGGSYLHNRHNTALLYLLAIMGGIAIVAYLFRGKWVKALTQERI